MPMPIAVMLSGRGSNFSALLDAMDAGDIDAQVVLVISDRSDAGGLDIARARGIDTAVIGRREAASPEAFDRANKQALIASGAKLVVLAGYLSVVRSETIRAYPHAILNIHPALLPSFGGAGYYGRHVHEAVLAAGCKLSGATVHFVTEEVDAGPIVDQAAVPVYDDDTAATLAARVLVQEHRLLPRAVAAFAAGRLRVKENIVHGLHPSAKGDENGV